MQSSAVRPGVAQKGARMSSVRSSGISRRGTVVAPKVRETARKKATRGHPACTARARITFASAVQPSPCSTDAAACPRQPEACNCAEGGRGLTLTLRQNSPQNAQAAAAELVIPSKELLTPKYCESIHQTKRRPTRTINVSPRARHGANGRRRQAVAGGGVLARRSAQRRVASA